MNVMRAKEILATLADGVDPMTGEVLPPQDCCNQAEVVRALHVALRLMETAESPAKKPKRENAGKPWSSDEESVLISEYQQGIPSHEIAKRHKRTQRAIAARLVHLGVVATREEVQ